MGDGADKKGKAAVSIRTASGERIEFTLPEYRLALLWLVDFEEHWEALELAASMVPDGVAKVALIRERLRPAAPHLSVLASRGIDSLELLAARFWFRQENVK